MHDIVPWSLVASGTEDHTTEPRDATICGMASRAHLTGADCADASGCAGKRMDSPVAEKNDRNLDAGGARWTEAVSMTVLAYATVAACLQS